MTTQEKAISYFEMYSNLTYDDTNLKHKTIVEDIAKFITNTTDNTGLQSISLNGINESYLTHFPDYILKAIDTIKKPKTNVRFL